MRAKDRAGEGRFKAAMQVPVALRFGLRPHAIARASAAVLLSAAGNAQALPQSGVISAGTATFAQPTANSMTITQTTPKLSINWQGFDIASGQSVVFNQPAVSSVVLNRVLGQSPTAIAGTLSANGQVFVVNPAGIVFGSGASVNVGGLVASSRPISDVDFLSGTYRFSGTSNGDVSNQPGSTLQVNAGGTNKDAYVALIGRQVTNAGTVLAPSGTALLAGTSDATLTITNGKLLGYTINAGVASALAQNAATGSITADGGRIVLTARGLDTLAPAVVNNEGVLQARTIGGTPGNIQLLATSDAAGANAGSVIVGSAAAGGAKLDVSAPGGGNGGSIVLSGPTVRVLDPTAGAAPTLTAAAPGGSAGTVQIAQTGADAPFAVGGGAPTISASTLNTTLGNAVVTLLSASDLAVNDPVSWTVANTLNLYAATNVVINNPISNTGGASLLLRADSAGTGTGTVTFNGAGSASMTGGGRTDLYYNPTSYATPTDYSAAITGGPYTAWMLVNDLAHLRAVRQSGSYALGRDIDASATATAAFTPIGDTLDDPLNFTGFSGDIDGLNHVISNLNIVGTGVGQNNAQETGFVGFLRGSLRNLGVESATVQGSLSVGLLAGTNQGSVSNSYATGTVNAVDTTSYIDKAGGLVGTNFNTIDKSWSSASVTGSAELAGGLAGYSIGTISQSYATGSVYGTASAGGLVGDNGGTISNSYSTGDASSPAVAGGLVGRNALGVIANSYSTGTPQLASTKGALVGQDSNGNVTNSRALDTGTGLALFGSTSGGTQSGNSLLTAAQMLNASNFAGFDFNTVWRQYEGHTAPLLKAFLKPLTVTVADPTKIYDGSSWSGPLPLVYSDPAAGAPGSALTVNTTIAPPPQPYTNAGSYTIGYTLDAWSSQRGWDITSIPTGPQTATLTIDAKPVTSTASATDRQYDGTSTVNVTLGALSGVAAGAVTVSSATGVMFDKNASGTPKQVFAQAVLANGTDNAANYVYYSPDGVTANISQRTLTVAAVGDTKTYDGQTSSTALPSVTGTINGDVAVASQSFGSRNVGTGIVLTPTVVIDDGNGGNNYAVQTTTATGTILPKTVSVSAVAADKVYDGTTLSGVLPAFDLGQLATGDGLAMASQTYASRNAGTQVRLTPSVTINDGNGGRNYTVVTSDAQGAITPRPLLVSAVSASKPYDGTATASGTPVLSEALRGTDSVLGASQRFDSYDVGNRRLIPSIFINDGNGGANYRVTLADAPGAITPAFAGTGGNSVVDTVLFNQGIPGPVALHAALLADPASRLPAAVAFADSVAVAMGPADDVDDINRGEAGDAAVRRERKRVFGLARKSGYQFDVKQGGMRLPAGVQ